MGMKTTPIKKHVMSTLLPAATTRDRIIGSRGEWGDEVLGGWQTLTLKHAPRPPRRRGQKAPHSKTVEAFVFSRPLPPSPEFRHPRAPAPLPAPPPSPWTLHSPPSHRNQRRARRPARGGRGPARGPLASLSLEAELSPPFPPLGATRTRRRAPARARTEHEHERFRKGCAWGERAAAGAPRRDRARSRPPKAATAPLPPLSPLHAGATAHELAGKCAGGSSPSTTEGSAGRRPRRAPQQRPRAHRLRDAHSVHPPRAPTHSLARLRRTDTHPSHIYAPTKQSPCVACREERSSGARRAGGRAARGKERQREASPPPRRRAETTPPAAADASYENKHPAPPPRLSTGARSARRAARPRRTTWASAAACTPAASAA